MKHHVYILPWVLSVWEALDRRLARTMAELVEAFLISRTFCLTDWARQLAPRRPPRTPRPRHRLLHRLKRVWRWVAHPRRDPVALQLQALPWLWQALGRPRRWVVAVDGTYGYLNTVQGKVLAVQIFCLALLWATSGPAPASRGL